MGRSPCCEKVGLKKGPWTPEEDQKLMAYIEEHGHGSWRALPAKAGLQRCGKSCRLRWTNYLRPDIKRGKFSLQEEQTIIQLHALLGNRWSAIATHLPKRTDNEIKNYWNTHLKKRLTKMGIDPVTHKPKTDAFGSGCRNPKDAANLSHMAQWESARLEAEARLVRESKLVPKPLQNGQLMSPSALAHLLNKAAAPPIPPCLDVLRAWQGLWFKSSTKDNAVSGNFSIPSSGDLESPISTLNYSEKTLLPISTVGFTSSSVGANDCGLMENDCGKSNHLTEEKEKILDNSMAWHDHMTYSTDQGLWMNGNSVPLSNFMEGFTDLLLENNDDQNSSDDAGENSDNAAAGNYGGVFEDHKNYWNSILNLVNSPPSDSSVF